MMVIWCYSNTDCNGDEKNRMWKKSGGETKGCAWSGQGCNVLKLDAQEWNESSGCNRMLIKNRMLIIECARALTIGCMNGRKEHAGGSE